MVKLEIEIPYKLVLTSETNQCYFSIEDEESRKENFKYDVSESQRKILTMMFTIKFQ